jgi:hypothetical protein
MQQKIEAMGSRNTMGPSENLHRLKLMAVRSKKAEKNIKLLTHVASGDLRGSHVASGVTGASRVAGALGVPCHLRGHKWSHGSADGLWGCRWPHGITHGHGSIWQVAIGAVVSHGGLKQHKF